MSDAPYSVVYLPATTGQDSVQHFLGNCPIPIQAKFFAVITAVSTAPPRKFRGGGYWEAMRGTLSGWYEIRIDGPPNRTHYRLFCLLDETSPSGSRLVIVAGLRKKFQTKFSAKDYQAVLALGETYWQGEEF